MKKLLWLGFFSLGVLSGIFIYHLRYHCLELKFSHHPFYGQFAQELKSVLRKHGYFFSCPALLPKTVIYFYQTDYNMPKPKPKIASFLTKHILFNGDCTQNIDFDNFKQFDAILNTDEFLNAYLSFYNLPTAHFPLSNSHTPLCHTVYKNQAIDLNAIATRLDILIQGINHDKY